tara:strand:- start:772 stop:1089 length:318 start_codon:yes stop_codon:yes gene_type:complete
VTKKITPETYEKMNEEFIEEGTMVRIQVPTQEQINNHLSNTEDIHSRTVVPTDMVAEKWVEYRKQQMQQIQDAADELGYTIRTVYLKDSYGKERHQIVLERDNSN